MDIERIGHQLFQEWKRVPDSGNNAEVARFNNDQLCEVEESLMKRILAIGFHEGIQHMTKEMWELIDTGISDTARTVLEHLQKDLCNERTSTASLMTCDSDEHVEWLRNYFLSETRYYRDSQIKARVEAEAQAQPETKGKGKKSKEPKMSKKEMIIAQNKERKLKGQPSKKKKNDTFERKPVGIEADVLKIVQTLLTFSKTDKTEKQCHELVYGAHTLISEIDTIPTFSDQIKNDLIQARKLAMNRWGITILDTLCEHPEISLANPYQGKVQPASNPKLRDHQRTFINEMKSEESTPVAYKVSMGQGKTAGIALLAKDICLSGKNKVVIAVTSLPQVRLQILRTAYLLNVPVAVAAFDNVKAVRVIAQRDVGSQLPKLIVCGPAEAAMLAAMNDFCWEATTVVKKKRVTVVKKTGIDCRTPDLVFCYDEPTMGADTTDSVELAGLAVFMQVFKTYRQGSKLALISSTLPSANFFGYEEFIEINTTSVQLGVSYINNNGDYILPHNGCNSVSRLQQIISDLQQKSTLLKSYPPSVVGKIVKRFEENGIDTRIEDKLYILLEQKGSINQSDLHQIVIDLLKDLEKKDDVEVIGRVCQKIPSGQRMSSSLFDILSTPSSYHGNVLLPTNNVQTIWFQLLRLIFNMMKIDLPRNRAKESFSDNEIVDILSREVKGWDKQYEASLKKEGKERNIATRTAISETLNVKNGNMTSAKSAPGIDIESDVNHAAYVLPSELSRLNGSSRMISIMKLQPLERLVATVFDLVIFDPHNRTFSKEYHDHVISSMQTGNTKFTVTSKYGAFGTDSPFCNMIYLDEELPAQSTPSTLRQLEARVARGRSGSDRGTIFLPNGIATSSVENFMSTGLIQTDIEGGNIFTALRRLSHPEEFLVKEEDVEVKVDVDVDVEEDVKADSTTEDDDEEEVEDSVDSGDSGKKKRKRGKRGKRKGRGKGGK